jgi:glyoxylase-like metal-dependent hydrolase (beta-lactamase superfamily II)
MNDLRIDDLGRGVVRVTQPLPWALDHVHCYVLDGEDGVTIVDCGLGTSGTVDRWRAALKELGRPQVLRVLVTHYHPDHLGAAAALADMTSASEIAQGELDAELARISWSDTDPSLIETYFLSHGMPDELAAQSASSEARLPVTPASPTVLLHEGDELELAGETFAVLELPGHADGHIALLGTESGRLLGGDVLLAEITPNIGRWPDTAPDPLSRYLSTLGRLEAGPPSIVYPGHGPVIEHAANRAAEIVAHHHRRLTETQDALRDGAETAYGVACRIWNGRLSLHEQRFALVEALSHLEHLGTLGLAHEASAGRWIAL